MAPSIHTNRTRRTLAAAGLVLVVAVAVVIAADPFGGSSGSGGGVGDNATATSLATVTRKSLSSQTQVSGTLGYAGSSSIRVPSGTAPSAVSQAEQSVTNAEGMLQTARASLAADSEALAGHRATVHGDVMRDEPPARVADLACGPGWSSIAIARAYPLVSVDGFDLDADAIQAARHNAEEAGLADRVTFAIADASGPAVSGQYDLVTILEGLHDISRPVDALRVARGMLSESGCVIVADELVEDTFTAPASLEEQYHYGWSVVACLPGVMGDPDTAATGAVMRPATLRRYALDAGFRDVEVLPVKAELLRFYRLTP